jgi:hypothetical protein
VHAAAGTCIADEHKARGRQRAVAVHTGAACMRSHDRACIFVPVQSVAVCGLFIERTTPLAPTKPNARKPARLAIMIIKTSL